MATRKPIPVSNTVAQHVVQMVSCKTLAQSRACWTELAIVKDTDWAAAPQSIDYRILTPFWGVFCMVTVYLLGARRPCGLHIKRGTAQINMLLCISSKTHCWRYSLRPHLGYVAALQEAYNTNDFLPQGSRKISLDDDVQCTRLRMALRVFVVSTGILGLRRFGDRTNPHVFTDPKRVVQGPSLNDGQLLKAKIVTTHSFWWAGTKSHAGF